MAPERSRVKTIRHERPKTADHFDVYRDQTATFRRKFGREMGPDDPFFFDPNAETPQFRASYEGWYAVDQIALIMGQAGVDSATVYAFRKTGGLFPTGDRPMTPNEIAQWTGAVNEYRRKVVAMPKR
jgi:hypothetical protein